MRQGSKGLPAREGTLVLGLVVRQCGLKLQLYVIRVSYGICSYCISTFNFRARTEHDYTMERETDLATVYSERKQRMIITAEITAFFSFSFFFFLEQEGEIHQLSELCCSLMAE